MKTRQIFAAALVVTLMLGVCVESAIAAPAKEKSAKGKNSTKTLKVLYWNIQNGMWAGQEDNYDQFVKWVKAQNPDICIWCEASTIYYTGTAKRMKESERYLPGAWGEVAKRYGHKYWFKGAQRDNYPQVITSRYPIRKISESVGDGADTLIIHGSGWAQVDVKGLSQPVNIVTLHPKPFSYGYNVKEKDRAASSKKMEGEIFRLKEVEFIVNHTIKNAKDADSEYWIMAGDYNSISRKDNGEYHLPDNSLKFLTHDYVAGKTPYHDAVWEFTDGRFCPSTGTSRRIDYFYVTKALMNAVSSVTWAPDEYTTRKPAGVDKFFIPSDHIPICVEFKLEKH